MSTVRWTFYDPIADETWVVPRNPNAMSDVPLVARQYRYGTAWGPEGRVPTYENAPAPGTLTFAGSIASEAHYNSLLDWTERPNEVVITDHLGRSFVVFITAFKPDEQTQTKRNSWRVNYTVEATILVPGGTFVGTAVETTTAQAVTAS